MPERPLPRGYRAWISLFPAGHRKEYGHEMVEALEHRWHRRRMGRLGELIFGMGTAADMIWNAFLLRGTTIGRTTMRFWTGMGLELRVIGRGLGRSPAFTFMVLGVLAVAVAANTAVFSYVRGTLFDPPPYQEPHDVVIAWGSNPTNGQSRDVISGSVYIDLARATRSLASLAAVHGDDVVLIEDARPVVVDAMEVTVDFLDVLGVEPFIGRDFGEVDRTSGGPATAIASYAFWRDRLDSDPDAVGSALDMDGKPTTIIGVLPEEFRFYAPVTLLVPLRDDLLAAEDRTHFHYNVLGRLRPDVTPSDATFELSRILATVAGEDPRLKNWTVLVERMEQVSVEAVRPALWVLSVAVTLVLLIAIVNLATLFRIRTLDRMGELSLRSALGAGRGRVIRLLLAEAIILSLMGGFAGVALAPALLGTLAGITPAAIPIPESAAVVTSLRATLDGWVRLTAVGIAVISGVLLMLPSLLIVSRGSTGSTLVRDRKPAPSGVRVGWLVGVELVLATLLLVGAGLTARSAGYLTSRDVGVVPDGVLTMYFGDVEARSVEERVRYFRAVLDAVGRVPGVVVAGTNDYLPFEGEDDFTGVRFPERPVPAPGAGVREEWRRVSEGLFEAAGMQIRVGRGFVTDDYRAKPAVLVVNSAFAAKHYPGRNPIGRRLSLSNGAYRDMEIVGVVADVLARGPSLPAPPVIYAPYPGNPRGHVGLYVRVHGDPLDYTTTVRDAIWSVEGRQPVLQIRPLGDLVRQATSVPRMIRELVIGLATIALLLAGMGVFGVVHYSVRSRRQELGIRLALGAPPLRLVRDLLKQTLPIVVVGIGTGLGFGAFVCRAVGAVLYGVAPIDSLSMVGAAAVMATVTLFAIFVPLRRVRRIDPIEAIRAD